MKCIMMSEFSSSEIVIKNVWQIFPDAVFETVSHDSFSLSYNYIFTARAKNEEN